jgi:hypothetical protein
MHTTACRALALASWVSAMVLGYPVTADSARTDEGGPPSRMLTPQTGPSRNPPPQSSPGTIAPNPGLDPRQILEQRLRHGQMEEPTAQGEVSNRLDRFYRSPDPLAGGRDPGGPVEQAGR